MRARNLAFLLTAILIFYFLVLGDRAALLMSDNRLAFKVLGVGVLAFPIVGIWVIWRELALGIAAGRMGQEVGDFSTNFESAKSAVEASPEDWRAWYILARVYGGEKDTKMGRAAMRKAAELKARESQR